jgi:phospholipid/cholesterol/gamma-HCH transport system substrate-binding protein
MEIRARYRLIGIFTLAVIAIAFTFIYWLNAAGGLARRTPYKITFSSPVAGLLSGSAVLFNGIRVGEVTGLSLDPQNPQSVTATVAIESRTPVRADTRVGLEFQGLTGAPVISLVGGTQARMFAKATTNAPILLMAEKDAGLGMSQAAREVLRHIDTVVVDNAEPIRSLIANIDKFSGALARNSDRVDGIVAGLERLTGGTGGKPAPRIYELAAVSTFPVRPKIPTGQLYVPEPTTLSLFETEKILVRATEGESPIFERAQWPDVLPKVLQSRILQSFENAGYLKVIGRAPDTLKSDHQLLTDLRSFHLSVADGAVAEVVLAARIVDAEGRIIDARVFSHRVPTKTIEPGPTVAGLNEAFAKVATDLVLWACAAL